MSNGIVFPQVGYVEGKKAKEVLFSTENLVKTGLTFAQGATAIEAGTVIGVVTESGEAVPYKTGSLDGSENPIGVALEEINVVDGKALGNVAIAGVFYKDALVGYDEGAKTALGAVDLNLGGLEVVRV